MPCTIIPLVLLAIAVVTSPVPATCQSIHPAGARIYLPRLRRILSLGGVHNNAPTTVISSLDLSIEWPASRPAITELATKLVQPVHDAIPVVTRRGNSTYDIMLYGGSVQSRDTLKRHMMSTSDGIRMDGFRAVPLLPEEYFSVDSTYSTVATVWDEQPLPRKPEAGAEKVGGRAFFVGGVALGVAENGGKPAPSNVTASVSFDKPADILASAELRTSGPGPRISAGGGLTPIASTEILIAGGTGKAAASEDVPWIYDLESEYWYRYQGKLPSPRSGNQLTTYFAPSGRMYVISVGGDKERPDDVICYSDASTQSNFTGTGPIDGLKSRFIGNHSVVAVGNQLLLLGGEYNPGTPKAESFQVVLFKIQEPAPGKLNFSLADKFTPAPLPPSATGPTGSLPGPGPSTDARKSGEKRNGLFEESTWLIVGSAIGVFVVTLLLAILAFRCCKCRGRNQATRELPMDAKDSFSNPRAAQDSKPSDREIEPDASHAHAMSRNDFFALALASPMVLETPCTPVQLDHHMSSSRRRSVRADGTIERRPVSLMEEISSARPDLGLEEADLRSDVSWGENLRR